MTAIVPNPASGVYAAISVLGVRFEWEIGWTTVFGFLLTVLVGYGQLCFFAGQKFQERRAPFKIQKAVPEELWLAKASGEKYHLYEDCGNLKCSNSKIYNQFCALCTKRSRLHTFKAT